MTINQNLDRISQAKSDIKAAIIAKGGTVGEDLTIDKYAAAIEALPSGGGEYDELIFTHNNNKAFTMTIKFQWLYSKGVSYSFDGVNYQDINKGGVVKEEFSTSVPNGKIYFKFKLLGCNDHNLNSSYYSINKFDASDYANIIVSGKIHLNDTIPYCYNYLFSNTSLKDFSGLVIEVEPIYSNGLNSVFHQSSLIYPPVIKAKRTGRNMFYLCSDCMLPDLTYLTDIPKYFIANSTKINEIIIPDNIVEIDDNAFTQLGNLTSVYIGKNVNKINWSSFGYNSNLSTIIVDENNTIYDSRNNSNCIIETSTNKLIMATKDSVLPNGLKTIGTYSISNMSSITTLTIPNGVEELESYSISNCSNLNNVTLPSSVVNMGAVFSSVPKLKDITIYATTPPTITSSTLNVSSLTSIYVPDESVDVYKAATNWNKKSSIIKPMSEKPTE